jgi:hypothetical protein
VRRWRYLGVVIFLSLFGLLGMQAWRSMVAPEFKASVMPRAAQASEASSNAASSATSSAPATAKESPLAKVEPVGAVSSAPAEPAASSADRELVLNLCGVGPLRLKPPSATEKRDSFETLPPSLGVYARSAAWPRILAAMEAAPDERSRAAALLLRSWGRLDVEFSLSQPQQPQADPSRWQRELAVMARSTSDAAVLHWALATCGPQPSLAECQALSPKDLVRLAPEDGSHWLALAADSRASPQERDAAFRRATTAASFGDMPSLAPAVDKAFPADLPAYLRIEMLVQTIGVEAAFPGNAVFGLASWCRQPATHERRAQCAALADALADRGQSLKALGMAKSLGKKNGWSDAKVSAVAAEEAALMNTLLNAVHSLDPTDSYTCKSVETLQRWLHSRASLGERAALKALR